MRHLSRAREEIVGCVIHVVLIIGFLVAVGFLLRALLDLFDQHGGDRTIWYQRATLAAVGVVMLLIFRRLWRKVREFMDLRREIRELGEQVRQLRDSGRRKDG